jgi:histidinol-phosphatase (PHP family)
MSDYHLHLYPHRRDRSVPIPPESYPLSHIERYVEQAAGLGLTELAFTEHLYRCTESTDLLGPFWEKPENPDVGFHTEDDVRADRTMSLERYVEAIIGAKEAGLPVLLGLEVDFFPESIEAVLEFIEPYPWDVLIGSIHWIDGWWFDRTHSIEEWDRRGHRKVYEKFFALKTELAASGAVDILAHVDRVKYLGHRLDPEPIDLYQKLVEAAARSGVAIELNTGGLRHPVAEVYPGPTLVEMMHANGIDITFASDGHTPEQVGWEFDALRRAALNAGYTHTARFRARRRTLVPIAAADS